jgi:MFS family permease
MNAASAFGRTLLNFISDTIGPLNVQIPNVLIAGILVLAWLGVHTLAPLLVIAILYGFFSGALISLPPAAVASMTKDMSTFGARMGLTFAFMAVGSLIMSPVVGAIVQSSGGNGYNGARIWSGVTVLGGLALMGAARVVIARREGKFFFINV